ncbi:MAG TPA: YdcF family protein [Candidatus Limnocylindrales bacterium]|nr:YdcF family protein [Candidatus Limnocylindrales bacterium]
MLRDLGRIVALGTAAVVVVGAYATFRIWHQGQQDERRAADAIVVLGAAQYDGRPSPVLRARLDHAVALYHDGIAPLFVVTGGKAEGDRTTEADAARRYAIEAGVPEEAILVEDQGRTTIESLRAVGELFRARGLVSAVFVSDRTHMLRVLRIGDDQGITGFGSPTTTSPIERTLVSRVDATVHELGALAVYFVTGDIPPEDGSAAEPGLAP